MLRIPDLLSIAHQIPTVYAVIAFLLFAVIASIILSEPSRPTVHVPSLDLSPRKQKQQWKEDAGGLLEEAYTKFPGQVFQVWTSEGPEVFIPYNMIDEVKAFPDDVLSIFDGLGVFFQSRHTTFPGAENPYWALWPRHFLAKNVANFIPIMKTELHHAMSVQFAKYADWQVIRVYPKLVQIVAAITSGIFVGPDLCRDELWLKTMINYTRNFAAASILLKYIPACLRSLFKFAMPQIWRIWHHNRTAGRIVGEALKRPRDEKQLDAVHSVREMVPEDRKEDYMYQGLTQVGLSTAGLHTTVKLLYHVLYDLATYPAYIPILREEIVSILGPTGEGYTVENYNSLKKLDSFLKESMRLRGGGVNSFRRKVLKPITLSDGTFLPASTYLSVPSAAISHDARLFPEPETFDGLRFYNMRQRSSEDANRPQLASLDNTAFYFGGGRHGCPGRGFASVEVKMIISALLLKYDFKMKDGDKTPREFMFQGLSMANLVKEILIRDRVDP